MGLFEQRHRQRETDRVRELSAGERQRSEVVAYLLDVDAWRRRKAHSLPVEQLHQGRLGPFDLAGEHGLLAHERVDESIAPGDHLARELEPLERLLGGPDAPFEFIFDDQGRRRRRQRVRDEDEDSLAPNAGGLPMPRLPRRHDRPFAVLVHALCTDHW